MALTFARFFVESPGNTIFAANYNGEFDSILTSTAAGTIDVAGLSNNVASFQVTEDPGEVASESLPVTFLGEFRRIRFALLEIKQAIDSGIVEWYESTTTTLLTGPPLVLGDGTGTGTTPDITINKGTGDAGIRLQVNNTSADAWDIFNDNSASDRLKLAFNGVDAIEFTESGTASTAQVQVNQNDAAGAAALFLNQLGAGDALIQLRVNGAAANTWNIRNDNDDSDLLKFEYNSINIFEVVTTADSSKLIRLQSQNVAAGPGANVLTLNAIPKVSGHLDLGAAGAVTVTDSLNIASASYSGANLTVNIDTDMANATYAAFANESSGVSVQNIVWVDNYAAGSFDVNANDADTGGDRSWASGDDVEVYAIGDQ